MFVLKIWSSYLLYALSCFEISFVTSRLKCPCSKLQYITDLSRYYRDMICFDDLKKLRSACSIWDKISIFHLGQTEHRSARCDGPHCALHRALINFTWSVPTWVPEHNSRLRVIRRTICWSRWSINIYQYLLVRKSQFPCGMLFLRLAQKQVRSWGRRSSSIVGFRSQTLHQEEH